MGRHKDLNERPDIANAINKVESNKVELRLSGLTGTRQEFRRNPATDQTLQNCAKSSMRINVIPDCKSLSTQKALYVETLIDRSKQVDDKGYHAILESVFRTAKIDIASLSKASKYTSSKIASRLVACGSLVRTIVNVGVVKLRYKTVKALVEHISQSLPTNDAGYCEPLLVDYLRALSALLEYSPHVEHFSQEDWHDVTNFCLNIARDLNTTVENSSIEVAGRESSRSIFTDATGPSPSFPSQGTPRLAYPQLQDSNDDILLCLRHLTAASNAPVMDRANAIVQTVLDLLSNYPHLSKIQQSCCDILDAVLARAMVSNLSLSLSIMKPLIVLFSRSWQRASQAQRESMLSILLRGQILIPRLLEGDEESDFDHPIQVLLEKMREQYCTRKPRAQLQMEDLDFSDSAIFTNSAAPLSFRIASLRRALGKVEEPFCTIKVSALLLVHLVKCYESRVRQKQQLNLNEPKRQKRASHMDELSQLLDSPMVANRIYALQVLAFLFELYPLAQETVRFFLELLLSHLSHDDSNIVSWHIFAIASLATQAIARSPQLRLFWLRAWRLISRHVTSTTTCGVACQALMLILEYQLIKLSEVDDVIDGMLGSTDLNGPAACDGSATKFWALLLRLRRSEGMPKDLEASSSILRWLWKTWSPGDLSDRTHLTHNAYHLSVLHTLDLILLCVGHPPFVAVTPTATCVGRLSKTSLAISRDIGLVRYLFTEDIEPVSPVCLVSQTIANSQNQYSDTPQPILTSKLSDHLAQECSKIFAGLYHQESMVLSSLSSEVVRGALQFCLIAHALVSSQGPLHGRSKIIQKLDQLRADLKQAVLQHDKCKEFVNVYCDFVAPLIGYISQKDIGPNVVTQGLFRFAHGLDEHFLKAQEPESPSNGIDDEIDAMDVDLDIGMRLSEGADGDHASTSMHDDIDASHSIDSSRACAMAGLYFIAGPSEGLGDSTSHTSSSAIVKYLTSLERAEFLLCKNVVWDLLEFNTALSDDDGDTLLQYVQQVIIRPYELERSEVAIGICLGTLTSLVQKWTVEASGDIAATGAELYLWFMNKVISGSTAKSSRTLARASLLLQQVVRIAPDYGKELSLASARTTLLELLRDGDLLVKHTIGEKLAELFAMFILKEHPQILGDIIDALPIDPQWIEGIALRLEILGNLAAAWPTLLRRCLYAIFETAGHVAGAVSYAKHSIGNIKKALKLPGCQDLFMLFSPQLFYTWLENQSLNAIPYHIFEYSTIKDSLLDVQDEVVGQIVMRGRTEESLYMAKELAVPINELLMNSFSKAAAYSIARDIAIPPSEGSQGPQAEGRLRKAVGRDTYSALIRKHMANIIAHFFTHTDQDDQVSKTLQKHPGYANASRAYQAMISFSCSIEPLPPYQQPSFKAKFLPSQMDHLCSRCNQEPATLWSPALYIYVFRKILSQAQPAMGSLHACAVLRKLRILICIVGNLALEGYPLEMSLRALQQFSTDMQCADDAVGVIQYLLQQGSPHLKTAPSFLLGFAVTTLVSLRKFLGSTQDSTTQESHFKATLSTANSYRDWLASFLASYRSPELSNAANEEFQAMAKATGNLRHGGGARTHTAEGELLVLFLEDHRSGRNLLPLSARKYLLEFMSVSFDLPADFREDIFGSDNLAAKYAPSVWTTCHWGSAGPKYLSWSARVLGRAYFGQSIVDSRMSHEMSLVSARGDMKTVDGSPLCHSRVQLLQQLLELLARDNSREIGMAELALSFIVTQSRHQGHHPEVEYALDSGLNQAMYGLEHVDSIFFSQSPSLGKMPSIEEMLTKEVVDLDNQWPQSLGKAIVAMAPDDALLASFRCLLSEIGGLAEGALPFLLHIILLKQSGEQELARTQISAFMRHIFGDRAHHDTRTNAIKILLNAILYLRTQQLPHESVMADRGQWLDLHFRDVAQAAVHSSMPKTALLFLELEHSERSRAEATSRRKSRSKEDVFEDPSELLLEIYQLVDEQDAFYGVKQPSSLLTSLSQLEHEHASFKSLSFRSALYDAQIRESEADPAVDHTGMVRALNVMDLNGLSQSLLASTTERGPQSTAAALEAARKLEQWDVRPPASCCSVSSIIFEAFRNIQSAADLPPLARALETGYADCMKSLLSNEISMSAMHPILGSLAILTEAEEVFCSTGIERVEEALSNYRKRDDLLRSQSHEHVKEILSCRETTFSCLSKRRQLQNLLHVSLREARLLECQNLLSSSVISRSHDAFQNALASTMYLNKLIEPCRVLGLEVSAAAQFESAHVLWAQGGMTASVGMLNELKHSLYNSQFAPQAIKVGKPELLATLGHHTAEARLQKPEDIITTLLKVAVKELHGATNGAEAGVVFHAFASFCDQQLQNPDSLADFHRIKKLRDHKEQEVRDLDRMIAAAGSQTREKDNLKNHRGKAQQWFKLDDGEYQRLESSRLTLVKYSLENYLLSLQASDEHDNDALRFSALWLEYNENAIANEAVAKYLSVVPSRKFASLMNQWTSRLMELPGRFQELLFAIIQRICVDHPYHGMYQIFASSKTRGVKDETTMARNAAANKVAEKLKNVPQASNYWLALHNTNVTFVRFAQEKLESSSIKSGATVALRKFPTGQRIEQDVLKLKVPPPTMTIDIRPDCDYSNVPTIARFQPEFTIAGGISMPKIVTAYGTDGKKYKQLFKGGNDDLRQDAIMEQVFSSVSSLLRAQRATRQRDLRVRTYKVLPLTAMAGVIEFVQNTVPLHDYLLPAHQRHFPKDLKPNACRKYIHDAQGTSTDNRIKVFRKVCEQFHPVLRYFFQEKYMSPDDWFDNRLAYTRSTAAISVLGHILGLGDRHGHNILLDEKTGEVVHIDLGIAFEQGRVLPVPEVVPFRLTRDLVDGMGITGTEGIFRRCCEFTLEALRTESYSIMTVLDVLRYDPLYSWSLSPLRLKKMQEAQTEDPGLPTDGGNGVAKKVEEEAGEAERALLVVGKKLSRTLSVQATVNELIQQATDEKNLAVLFCGWAAYA